MEGSPKFAKECLETECSLSEMVINKKQQDTQQQIQPDQ